MEFLAHATQEQAHLGYRKEESVTAPYGEGHA
jgi:hypothetical protein